MRSRSWPTTVTQLDEYVNCDDCAPHFSTKEPQPHDGAHLPATSPMHLRATSAVAMSEELSTVNARKMTTKLAHARGF